MIWILALPPPPRPPVSKLDWRHTGRVRKRDNLLTGVGKQREGEEPNNTTAKSLVLYKSFNTDRPYPTLSVHNATQIEKSKILNNNAQSYAAPLLRYPAP
jgi:hypothetical protein